MTWTPPLAAPPSYIWLQDADHSLVTYPFFLTICNEWIEWQRALGVDSEFHEPESWVQGGDLQTFANVVSWWPKTGIPVHLSVPTLAGMVMGLRKGGVGRSQGESFAQNLQLRVDIVKAHIRAKGGDAENPNETAEDRYKRKNRERQARWQLNNRPGSDDPEHNALIEAAKLEAKKLTEWKAYLRKYVKEQKLLMDATIRAARQTRDDNIKAAEQAISEQEIRMLDAKDALTKYSSGQGLRS